MSRYAAMVLRLMTLTMLRDSENYDHSGGNEKQGALAPSHLYSSVTDVNVNVAARCARFVVFHLAALKKTWHRRPRMPASVMSR
eukprot:2516406-Rhodomonas_salina.2